MKNRYVLDPSGKVKIISEDGAVETSSVRSNDVYKNLDHFITQGKNSEYNETYLGNYVNKNFAGVQQFTNMFDDVVFSTSLEIDSLFTTAVEGVLGFFGEDADFTTETFENAARQIIEDRKPSFGFINPNGSARESVSQGAFRQLNSFLNTTGNTFGLSGQDSVQNKDVIPYVDEFEFYTGYRDSVVEESALIPALAFILEYFVDIIIEVVILEAIMLFNREFNPVYPIRNTKEGSFHVTGSLVLGEWLIDEMDVFSKYFFEVLNYPVEKGLILPGFDYPLHSLKIFSCFVIGFNEWVSHDRIIDWDKVLGAASELDKTSNSLASGVGGFIGFVEESTRIAAITIKSVLDITLSSLTNSASLKRIMMLIKKFNTQKYWVQKQLYSAKRKSIATSYIVDSLNYYYFKFFIERLNVGIKIWERKFDKNTVRSRVKGTTNRLAQEFIKNTEVGVKTINHNLATSAKSAKDSLAKLLTSELTPGEKKSEIANLKGSVKEAKENTAEYEFAYNFGNLNLSNIPSALMFNRSIGNVNGVISSVAPYNNKIFAKTDKKRLPIELVNKIEAALESEYMPFYFHDIRTNEIVSFHAFIENISDSYSPEYTSNGGFGRIDDVKAYVKTTRSISLSFIVAAMNKEDHDTMWYYLNKLVTMVYPQWSKGEDLVYEGKIIQQPFSQVPTNSPLIRLRIGDLIKNNYSKFNLTRIFGLDDYIENRPVKDKIALKKQINKKLKSKLVSFKERILRESEDLAKIFAAGQGKIKKETAHAKYITLKNVPFEGNFKVIVGKVDYTQKMQDGSSNHGAITWWPVLRRNTLSSVEYNINNTAIGHTYEYKDIPTSVDFDDLDFIGSKSDLSTFFNQLKSGHGIISEDELFDKATINEMNEIMKPFNTDGVINNPITQSYESGMSKGLAGHITQLDYNYTDANWDITPGSKAPMMVKVTMSFAPIHDIPLGLDYKGMPRAVNYNVGGINSGMFGDPLQKYKTEGEE